jgi:uncharacterized protein YnzC (UPF0291/DUF896 family)
MMKKRYLLLLVIVLCVLLVVFILWPQKKTMPPIVETSLPVSEQKAYVDKINIALEKDRKERLAYEKIKDTPEEVAKRTKYWNKLKTFADSQLKNIDFYGKVIDQNGNPVPDMQVEYSGHSGYLSEGTGVARTQTNAQGVFTLTDAKGVSFSINKMNKLGYDANSKNIRANFYHYKRFEDSALWQDYTEDNPYVFKVWKIEKYAKVNSEKNRYYFYPDGRIYSLDLSKKGKHQFEVSNKGSLNVSFIRTDEHWQLTLTAPNGGFLEADDTYMNAINKDQLLLIKNIT